MKLDTLQATKVFLITYLTNEEIDNAIFKLGASFFAYIRHSKDFDSNGELKKEHAHVVLSFDKRRSINKIAKAFNVAPNLVQVIYDLKTCVKYLIHSDPKSLGDETKYKYQASEIISSDNRRVVQMLSNSSYNETAFNLMVEFICKTNQHYACTTYAITRYLYNLGYSDWVNKNFNLIKTINKEMTCCTSVDFFDEYHLIKNDPFSSFDDVPDDVIFNAKVDNKN